MKKNLLFAIFTLAIVFAGVSFCRQAYAEQNTEPWNVNVEIVNGEDTAVYNLKNNIKDLKDQSEERLFYSGYNERKKLYDYLLSLDLPREAVYEYIFPNFKQIVSRFDYVTRDRIDAAVNFGKNGFAYTEGRDGVRVDTSKLFELMLNSGGKKMRIRLPLEIDKALTVAELKRNTVKKASFTTQYASSGANRCFNIAKAASSLNGIAVEPGQKFSFNEIVGERTEANGYKTSKIILDGNYQDGVGGGVCQVSTTLYNALLLAGFLPRAAQHSLISGYVKAGFDAMVSYGTTDLTFVNDTEHPIYISASINGKSVTFTVYGEPNKYRVERESVEERDKFCVIEIVDSKKYPELVYEDQIKVITSGSDGVKTKSYLKYYDGDTLVEKKLIRSNNYKRVDKVVAKGALPRPAEDSFEGVK